MLSIQTEHRKCKDILQKKHTHTHTYYKTYEFKTTIVQDP